MVNFNDLVPEYHPLASAGVDEEIQDDLIECLEAVGIIFEPDM